MSIKQQKEILQIKYIDMWIRFINLYFILFKFGGVLYLYHFLTFSMSQAIPSCKPSLVTAEHAKIDQSLPYISSNLSDSVISSGGKARETKSCLLAKIKTGMFANFSSSKRFCSSWPLYSNLFLSLESMTNTRPSVLS